MSDLYFGRVLVFMLLTLFVFRSIIPSHPCLSQSLFCFSFHLLTLLYLVTAYLLTRMYRLVDGKLSEREGCDDGQLGP